MVVRCDLSSVMFSVGVLVHTVMKREYTYLTPSDLMVMLDTPGPFALDVVELEKRRVPVPDREEEEVHV